MLIDGEMDALTSEDCSAAGFVSVLERSASLQTVHKVIHIHIKLSGFYMYIEFRNSREIIKKRQRAGDVAQVALYVLSKNPIGEPDWASFFQDLFLFVFCQGRAGRICLCAPIGHLWSKIH